MSLRDDSMGSHFMLSTRPGMTFILEELIGQNFYLSYIHMDGCHALKEPNAIL